MTKQANPSWQEITGSSKQPVASNIQQNSQKPERFKVSGDFPFAEAVGKNSLRDTVTSLQSILDGGAFARALSATGLGRG